MKNVKNITTSTICLTLIILAFFPYVTPINLGTDTQPWPLLTALIIFLLFRVKFCLSELLLGIVVLFSIFTLTVSEPDFNSLRSLSNYASLFLISYAVKKSLINNRIKIEKVILLSIFIWLCTGFIQTFFDREFLNIIISAARTTENRGVVGLAPEPTSYGIVLIFSIIILTHLNIRYKFLCITLCVIGVAIFAQSSMALLFLLILITYYAILFFDIRYAAGLIFLFFITYSFASQMSHDSRIFSLINILFSEPSNIILIDASINDRFFHVFFSVNGFFSNYMLPHGFSAWNEYSKNQISNYSNFVISEWFTMEGRVMSGYGSALFELGLPALLIPASTIIPLWNIYNKNVRLFIFYSLFINTIMFSAIPIGFPIFAFYIGFLNYISVKQNLLKNTKEATPSVIHNLPIKIF